MDQKDYMFEISENEWGMKKDGYEKEILSYEDEQDLFMYENGDLIDNIDFLIPSDIVRSFRCDNEFNEAYFRHTINKTDYCIERNYI